MLTLPWRRIRDIDRAELRELAAGVSETAGFEHGTGLPAGCVKLVVAAIGIGPQDIAAKAADSWRTF